MVFFFSALVHRVCCAINLPATADENKAVRLNVALLHDGPVSLSKSALKKKEPVFRPSPQFLFIPLFPPLCLPPPGPRLRAKGTAAYP